MTTLQIKLARLEAQLKITKGKRAKAKLIIAILAVEAAIEAIEKNTIVAFKRLPKTRISVISKKHTRTNQMSATLKEIEKCEALLKEIEDKWDYQDSIGYSRDSYDAGLYCKTLEKIARLKWVEADLTNAMPSDTDLFNWGKEQVARKNYTMPRQPNSNQSYLNIGVVDFQELRNDYWAYYGKCD